MAGAEMAASALSLDAVLSSRAAAAPDHPLFEFLDMEGRGTATLTLGSLEDGARRLGRRLAEAGAIGQPVLVVVGPGPEQPLALFGCFAAGATAVPVYPPASADAGPAVDVIARIAEACGARLMVATAAVGAVVQPLLAQRLGGAAPTLITLEDAEAAVPGETAALPGSGPADAALLLYTSGSTGMPKGVVITHAGIVGNMRDFAAACGRTHEDIACTWLPHAHIAGLYLRLLPLVVGGRCVVLPPQSFLARPMLWLEVISRCRATISAAPDFAYGLLAQAATDEMVSTLDLSSWEMAVSGGEVVRAATVDRFLGRFAPAGLREDAFYPYYGLTETLCTSVPQRQRPARLPASRAGLALGRIRPPESEADGVVLIGNGAPLGDTEVVVVDPATCAALPPGRIGELWVRGSAVTPGYHGAGRGGVPDDAWARLDGARLDDDGPYFRTGDLGLLHDGQVFVTGRLKELLIVRGKNHHPQDIEATAIQAAAGLGLGACAAFTVMQDDEEALGLAFEAAEPAAVATALMRAVRPAVSKRHGLAIARLFLVPPGSLPRTPTGKLVRHVCRDRALSGDWSAYSAATVRRVETARPAGGPDFAGLAGPALAEAILTWMLQCLAEGESGAVPADQVDRPAQELGLSSLDLVRVATALRRATGCEPPLAAFFDGSTLRAIARQVAGEMEGRRQRAAGPAGWRNVLRQVALAMPDVAPPLAGRDGAILLTGATGFLGSWLLAGLLRRGARDVRCLVRADSEAHGMDRLIRALAGGPGWRDEYRAVIRPVIGDVTHPALGLDQAAFANLAGAVSTIVHNAADVNFVAPYAVLKAANVDPVHALVRLALFGGHARTVHFVSTLAVFNASNRREQRLVRSTDRLTTPDHLYSGYAQSKWVAESAFRVASSRGIPLGIHRPGLVVGDSRTGQAHTADFLCRFVKGCIELGRYPDAAIELDLVPVDDVADGIAAAVLRPVDGLETFHWSTPTPVPLDRFMAVFQARGHGMTPQPVAEWLAHLRAALPPENALFPVHPFLLEQPPGSDETILDLLDGLPLEIETVEADALRAEAGLTATPMTDEVMDRMAAWLESVGFLPTASAATNS